MNSIKPNKVNHELLKKIREGDVQIIESIYERYFSKINSFVLRNSGSEEDARDVFQECMFQLFQYSRRMEAPHIENFEAYFFGMCRNKWFSNLAKRKRNVASDKENAYENDDSEDHYYYIYLSALEKLNQDCREILNYYVEGKKTEEMAQLLDTTVDYAKRKKYLCKEKLKAIALAELKVYEQ
jgi:RNA polymerase sigma factor (sigma-70 family)